MSLTCFMGQPFDGGKFDKRFDDVFAPAVKEAGLIPYRVDRDSGAVIPIDDVERNIRAAAVCFFDITLDNPNVWFELGYAIAAGKDLCLVCSSERQGHYPFDVQHRKIIKYSCDAPRDFHALKSGIVDRLRTIIQQQKARPAIQTIAKEAIMADLKNYEAVVLVRIASEIDGVNGCVSIGCIKNEMEKAGYNSLATNTGIRGLLAREMIDVKTASENFETFEVYAMTEGGWDWINENTHTLDLKAQPKGKNVAYMRSLDDEIPF